MKQYLDLLKHVMETGVDKPNRTGIDTRSVFGAQMRFDLSKGFQGYEKIRDGFKDNYQSAEQNVYAIN